MATSSRWPKEYDVGASLKEGADRVETGPHDLPRAWLVLLVRLAERNKRTGISLVSYNPEYVESEVGNGLSGFCWSLSIPWMIRTKLFKKVLL